MAFSTPHNLTILTLRRSPEWGIGDASKGDDRLIEPDSQVKHIFTKLNVEKRAQAVSRAQSLGLVGTH